eukprot:jgi/Botrbrau1/2367/Bobra.0395s0002.1
MGVWLAQSPDLSMNFEDKLSFGSPCPSSNLPPQHPEDFLNRIRPWIIDFKDLRRKREIGKGSAGTVHLCTWRETDVAVKQLHVDVARYRPVTCSGRGSSEPQLGEGATDDDSSRSCRNLMHWRSLEREVNVLCSLRHPHVLMFMGVCLDPPSLVTEYCSRGSLASILYKAHHQPELASCLSWLRRLTMIIEVAKGVLQLHEHNPRIIHRDLKAGNVLVDKSWRCKVADFNLSHMEGSPPILCHSTPGQSLLPGPRGDEGWDAQHSVRRLQLWAADVGDDDMADSLGRQLPRADDNGCAVAYGEARHSRQLGNVAGGHFCGDP